jgi:hypothetical protein
LALQNIRDFDEADQKAATHLNVVEFLLFKSSGFWNSQTKFWGVDEKNRFI